MMRDTLAVTRNIQKAGVQKGDGSIEEDSSV